MTNEINDRLNQTAALLSETAQLTRSNARAIQALGDQISELTNDVSALTQAGRQATEERAELRQATIGIVTKCASDLRAGMN